MLQQLGRQISLATILALTAGCNQLVPVNDGGAVGLPNLFGSTAASQPAHQADPVLQFVATAPDGGRTNLPGAAGQPPTNVVAGRRYTAASGLTCREYGVRYGQGATRIELACADSDGVWARHPMVVTSRSRLAPRL